MKQTLEQLAQVREELREGAQDMPSQGEAVRTQGKVQGQRKTRLLAGEGSGGGWRRWGRREGVGMGGEWEGVRGGGGRPSWEQREKVQFLADKSETEFLASSILKATLTYFALSVICSWYLSNASQR